MILSWNTQRVSDLIRFDDRAIDIHVNHVAACQIERHEFARNVLVKSEEPTDTHLRTATSVRNLV